MIFNGYFAIILSLSLLRLHPGKKPACRGVIVIDDELYQEIYRYRWMAKADKQTITVIFWD
jgi:hypothetical protein